VRILWVKADKLLPVQNGGNIRSYNIVRQLAERHEVVFFSYYGGEADREYERELERQLPGAVCVCTGKQAAGGVARGMDYLAHLGHSEPYAVSRFVSRAVEQRLEKWSRERRFDIAVCDFLDAAVNFPAGFSIPTVLFQHNVEAEIWRRYAETAENPAKRLMYRLEYSKMLGYEQSKVRDFEHVIAVSENDRQIMSQWTAASRITVVPTGVDLKAFRTAAGAEARGPVVMFIGAMDWPPNVDGVEYFCGRIWAKVRAAVPGAQLRIVGRNPDRRVQKLAGEGVTVTGRVPSVVEHLRDAAVVVVPLRVGGGTRLKIYEAMAAGRAVVSTTIGAEGLDVHHGRDIVLADEPDEFAEAVVMLLKDAGMRQKYERAASELAARYDWFSIGDKFGEVLEQVVIASRAGETLPAGASGGRV
jgi:glycosyltransferase involved in cell wall biosynthesis